MTSTPTDSQHFSPFATWGDVTAGPFFPGFASQQIWVSLGWLWRKREKDIYSRCWKSEQLVGWKGLLHWKLEYIAENSENQWLEDDDIHFRNWNGPFLRGEHLFIFGEVAKRRVFAGFWSRLRFCSFLFWLSSTWYFFSKFGMHRK